MRRIPFVTFDVFTQRPLEGNQLAIFPEAGGLSDAEMQALARETKLSETTFILPRDAAAEREQGVPVRIFTVEEELPFAGHPTLGTAALIHKQRGVSEVTLDLRAGKVSVRFTERDGGIFGEMTQRDPVFGSIHSKEAVAEALQYGLEFFDPELPVQTVSTGLVFAIVPVASVEQLKSLRFDQQRAAVYLEKTDAKFLYFIARDHASPVQPDHFKRFRSRMIFYNGEDPATGSAAGCATAWMVQHGVLASDESALIEQGVEMHRPSQIYTRASKNSDGVHNVRVGGYSVEVMRGEAVI